MQPPPAALPHHRVWYWSCQLAGWGAYAGVNYLLFRSMAGALVSICLALLFSGEGVLITHAYRGWVRRRGWLDLPAGPLLARIVPAVFLLAMLLLLLVPLNVWMVRTSLGKSPIGGEFTLGALFGLFFNLSFLMALWSALYFGFHFFLSRQRAEIDRWRLQAALTEAELRALRAQVNPHFLFNSLNSLRSLILENPARARDSVTQLAAILRYSLESGAQRTVPLAAELRMVDDYLALEAVRFESRLEIRREIDPAALTCPVPPMLVQTLVENAVKYGVSREPGPGWVALRARCDRDSARLIVEVSNRGTLGPADGSTGLGLANARERLARLFGPPATLTLDAHDGEVRAIVQLPISPPTP